MSNVELLSPTRKTSAHERKIEELDSEEELNYGNTSKSWRPADISEVSATSSADGSGAEEPYQGGTQGPDVLVDDPPLEDTELEGTKKERYEAALKLMEYQGKVLRMASRDGDVDRVLKLMEEKVDPNVVNASGTPPLHEAAYAGKFDVIAVLLHYRADVALTDVWGGTALHFAATKGDPDCCRLLLQAGADVDCVRQDRKRPYDCLDRDKFPETFELLVCDSMQKADERKREQRRQIIKYVALCIVIGLLSYAVKYVMDMF